MASFSGKPLAQNPYNPFTGTQVQTISSSSVFPSSNTFQAQNNSNQSGSIFGNNTQTQSLFGNTNTQGSVFSQPQSLFSQPQGGSIFGQNTSTNSIFGQNNQQGSVFSQNSGQNSVFSQNQPIFGSSQSVNASQQNSIFSQGFNSNNTLPFSSQQSIFGANTQQEGHVQQGSAFGFTSNVPQVEPLQQQRTENVQLEEWMLEAYKSDKFQKGRIPEIPPTNDLL
ncbi:hypothetical protein BEWA_005030 [Theileria equi strain WA]|uniref:Nucleoporin n=1 Tax=Theileria equi strain WA TaxID=1537102 RepID=L0AZU9_THEEQ|nr:hypothetical protein BEWA_005030 [Theileria equi strain WA]AFZ81095.1 hypothetical protein BEWA_005030 [Theileria equi strain WA]|eukprot:XP_004830761.1 hypothetical protein BEWA_005030 [Theileria equi strain WA]